jgi:sarcosine oxidase subunit beta
MSTFAPSTANTDPLPSTAQVVVIGGGVNGLSTAFQLAVRGVENVVVLERAHLGSGASGKSGALVRAHYTNVPEARLTHESIKIFKNWSDLVGAGDPGYEETGFIRVVSPADEPALWANVAALREDVGIDTYMVTPEELREIEPLMRTDDITYAAFEPHAGFCDPNATLYGFANAANDRGVRIHTFTTATRVIVDGRRVVAVETNHGRIATDTVVIAAGATADRLLVPLGLDLGLTPWRSQVVVFRWPPEVDHTRRHRVVIDSTQHSWFRCEGAAGTLIGAEYGDRRADPDTYNESVDPGYVDHARRALAARFPIFANATMRGAWSGVYMQSPDSHPIIDRVESVDGLFIMAGDAGTSFKTSPAIGVCLAEWITEGAPKLVDLTPFRSTRFAERKPWVDEHAYDAEGTERTIAR